MIRIFSTLTAPDKMAKDVSLVRLRDVSPQILYNADFCTVKPKLQVHKQKISCNLEQTADPVNSLNCLNITAEGCKPEIAFATWSETAARSTGDTSLIQHMVEEIP